nr:hypothetical protein [Tanacetum cinerariifolium]
VCQFGELDANTDTGKMYDDHKKELLGRLQRNRTHDSCWFTNIPIKVSHARNPPVRSNLIVIWGESWNSLLSSSASKVKSIDGKNGKGGMKPISFAFILKDNTSKKMVKIAELSNDENVKGADVAIPLAAVDENIWLPNSRLKKDEIAATPVWVKLHNVPIVAYSEIGFSLITTKLGGSIMLDAYMSTMCLKSWGRNNYARALIEVSSKKAIVDSLVVAIPFEMAQGDEKCPKHAKDVNLTQVSDDGFVEVIRKNDQQTLTESRGYEIPLMLEKGSYIPWASQFMRFPDNKQEEGEMMRHSIEVGPYEQKMIQNPDKPDDPTAKIIELISKMTKSNKQRYYSDIKVINYILQRIPNDISNSVNACTTAKQTWERIRSHPSSVIDHEEDYQGEIQGDAQEDKLTNAMMLLARAITQRYSTPTNNRLHTSSNTRNQAVIQDGGVDIQRKNVGYVGNDNNDGTDEHDSNAHGQSVALESLIYNGKKEAENKRSLNNKLKKQKALLQKELETCKERVRSLEKQLVKSLNYKEEYEELEQD